MYNKQKKRTFTSMPAKRGLSLLLAGFMMFSNVVPSLGTLSAYAISPDQPVNPDGTIPNGNKPQDTISTEELFVNDTPLRLQVSKVKTAVGDHEGLNPKTVESTLQNTITYKVSGRIEGKESDLMNKYGADQIELARSTAGTYLGYGWLKGTLEYLTKRQKQNVDEEISIKYNQAGIFEGYAYITKTLETADDINRYVAGATMTLYDAVEISKDPAIAYDKDDKWRGVTVERDPGSGNVQMVYVNKGYAGNRIEYVKQKLDSSKVEIDQNGTVVDDNYNYQDAINDTGEGVWIAETIQREDTPILFYSFDNLHVTTNDVYTSIGLINEKEVDKVFGSERYNKADSLYGFDKYGNVVNIDQYDNRDFSIFAFEDGETKPVFEFYGGDFDNIHYSQPEKMFRFYDEDGNEDKNMKMYHLDEDGNRDALVDPTTGIAYVTESTAGDSQSGEASEGELKIAVWPVNTFYDGTGNSSENERGSHYFQKIVTTRPATINADTENEYVFGTLTGDKFENRLNPVLDQYGHPVYQRVSDVQYVKGQDRYDYDNEEYLGYTYEDGLDYWNENAYVINDHNLLYNTDKDDPFNQETHYQYTDKQAIKVTVDKESNFIVNGNSTVPVPTREGYVFGGWLLDPNELTDSCTVKAYWRNGNNTMDPEEEQQWYSKREALGVTDTIRVTFDANGGAFRAGSGDIHSTDYPLYRRLGDAYIINNTWVTGENTPNDPFDEKKVDTVGNTAENLHTISSDGKTANDVYSNTTSGGQADMLKRLPSSLYIMEELEAPDGYIKGFPTLITMNETTEVQTSEMTDKTIKVEIVKIDATENPYKAIRKDGEIQMSADNTKITKLEAKGNYSYEHVAGAVLSMKGKDDTTKKAFSDWVKVTSAAQFTKKNSGGTWYIEFNTSEPLFLEGIPAGEYLLTEVVTPAGYVTMTPQTITVGEYDGVQIYGMTDEHIKVEIDKYYEDDDGTIRHLPNADRAKLGLYNSKGELVGDWYTNDASDYISGGTSTGNTARGNFLTNAWKKLTSAFTKAENVDYSSFVSLFNERYNNGDVDFKTISWNVKRNATLNAASTAEQEVWKLSDGNIITITNGTMPENAPAEFTQAYANKAPEATSFEYTKTLTATKDEARTTGLGDQYWNVDNDTVMHICVSVDDDSSGSGYQSYRIDYQFEFTRLSGAYEKVNSYLTVDGTRRFDYLPKGDYTVKELEVPEGYAVAEDKSIKVESTEDIQIFTIENKKRTLEIAKFTAKKAEDGSTLYFAGYYNDTVNYTPDKTKAAVVGGIDLSLYWTDTRIDDPETAFKGGAVPENVTLIDKWTTGKDGVYTEYEYQKELITKEMIGQFKPHTVKTVQDGWYYLVETAGLNYMFKAAPVEFEINDQTTAAEMESISMVNETAPLKVQVKKTDENGTPLANAIFEVSNKNTGALVGTLVTDKNGEAMMNIADTGVFSKDGKLTPYTFQIRETAAPAGYMLDPTVHDFTLSEDNDGFTCKMFNSTDKAFENGVLHVTNEPSTLSISKKDFYSKEVVEGTELQVTKAVFENGQWRSDGATRPEWTWTVNAGEDEHGLSGIAPDTNYVLHELSVPNGYTKQGDVFFHTNTNGLGIDKIWFDPSENHFVSFDLDDSGAVAAMHTNTRSIKGTKAIITDLDTGLQFESGVNTNGRIVLTKDNVVEGHVYNIKTSVTFSDTSTQIVDSMTFIAEFTGNELWVWAQYANASQLHLTDDTGNTIYQVGCDDSNVTILNPESDYADTLTVSEQSAAGKEHAGVKAGNIIHYQVDYQSSGKQILIYPGTGLSITKCEPAASQYGGGAYIYDTVDEAGTLNIWAVVNDTAAEGVTMRVSIGETDLYYMNPVVISGKTGVLDTNDSLVITNAVTGSDPENGTAEFTYKVTLTKPNGKPLSGGYDYRTKLHKGMLTAFDSTKEFSFILTGNDYIVIHGLPADTNYKIVMESAAVDGFSADKKTAEGTIADKATVNEAFTNHRSITSERALLKKNQSYYMQEVLTLSTKDFIAESYGFSLDDMCRVTNFILMNRPTTVEVEKRDEGNGDLLAGAQLTITTADGTTVLDNNGNPLTWSTVKALQSFSGILNAGETYYVKELAAPDGYTVSAPIAFTVSEDGAVDRIIVQDKKTDVTIKKIDAVTGESLAGVFLQIIDKNGKVVSQWTTDSTGTFQLQGVLTAGETYTLHEESTVDGYYYSYDVEFTVNTDGSAQVVEMRDRPIKVVTPPEEFPPETPPEDQYPIIWLLKGDKAQAGTAGQPIIPGGTYQVLEKDAEGNDTIIMQISDPDMDGKFTMDGTWKEWNIVLQADKTYYLHEIKAPDGYQLPDGDVEFTVSHYGEDVQVPIYNEKIKATFEKTDFAGNEVAGATCELRILEGTEWKTIDSWVSQIGASHVMEGTLIGGREYLYVETGAPDGYAYTASIRFTMGTNGIIQNARYVNAEGKSLVFDGDGRPTNVTYRETLAGTIYELNGEELELKGGNLIDKAGNIVVAFAGTKLPVIDNVVVMKDDLITATFEKTDFGGNEISGAVCVLSVRNENGTLTEIDKWTSQAGESHTITGKLYADKTYVYHEELSATGYEYSYDIAFTVNPDGDIVKAHYLDPDGNPVLYDRGGYPTSIRVLEDGTYRDGEDVIIIDESGNAVDESGSVRAYGVKYEITTENNVVTMKDEAVKTVIIKYDNDGNELDGGIYSIYDAYDEIVKAVTDTEIPSLEHEGMILAGEELTFAAAKGGVNINKLLTAGKEYTLKEIKAPQGYTLHTDGVKFIAPVYNQSEPVKVVMTDTKIPLRLAKVDETGNMLPGASLELYVQEDDASWTKLASWTSDTSAKVFDGVLEYGRQYKYHEVKAPDGYLAIGDILFTIDENGVVRNARYDGSETDVKVVNNMIEMDNIPLSVSFEKTDLTGMRLTGAGCELYLKNTDGTRTKIDAWTSGTQAHTIAGTALKAGATYIYHESYVPAGYGKSADIEFTIAANGKVSSAHYINADGETVLYDKNGFTTNIVVKTDGTFMDGTTVITIDENGNAVDADGNLHAEGVKADFAVTSNTVIMKDAPTDVILKKVDSVTGESLAGAKLQVIDKNGTIISEWTTSADGTFELKATLIAGETYTLHEEETVDGYYYSYDVTFTVNEDGKPQIVEMRNRPIKVVTPPDEFPPELPPEGSYPTIWLLKNEIGDPDHILQGGTFQVLSEDKTEILISDFTMNGTLQEWYEVLKADHTYWLHEVTPPDGFAKAEDVKFTVSHYGEDVQVVMSDKKTEVILKKVDQLTGESLAGATLQLYKGPKKPPYATYDPADLVAEWTTDETGTFKLSGQLVAGETYTLHETVTVQGYYYSYDIDFVVNADGKEQTIVMQNRRIVVDVPTDELPKPTPDPEGTKPDYEMEKERITLAPEKADTADYGFYHKDTVDYDVTIRNTGETELTMDVNDSFEEDHYFSTPRVSAVKFYASATGRQNSQMGVLNRVGGSIANITIKQGGYAVITYESDVLDTAKENLSGAAEDDGLRYLNTATTTNVTGKYYEYSGEDKDGDGKGDIVTEVIITKKDYPEELKDKSDDANTPVQIHDPETETPRYVMTKTRVTDAPAKEDTDKFGFFRGDTVTYQVNIENTGNMPLKMYVSDEFAHEIRTYFEDLKITKIEGEDISETGTGIGTTTARIRIEPAQTATITYTAVISEKAPERLSFTAKDDGNGYLNIAKTYEVKAEKPDGTEGDKTEYPGIPDKEDEGNTPVQTTDKKPEIIPPGPNEPEYPIIWLLKNSVEDPSHILPGGIFQVLDEDGNVVLDIKDTGDNFGIGYDWREWQFVLEADKTYYLHEVTPPDGYLPAEDVKFTVGHYGEMIEVVMTDKKKNDGITFSKQDFAGNEIAGAKCILYKVNDDGTETIVDAWISAASQHTVKGKLESGATYRYHEELAPDGYGYSVDAIFTVDDLGNVTTAYYVNKDGETVLFDKNGLPTEIIAHADGTYSLYEEAVTIDSAGNAIGEDGAVLAYGVQKDVAVSGNTVVIKDEPTKVHITKTDEAGNTMNGGLFEILDAGKNVVKAISNTQIASTEHDGVIMKGEALRFKANENGIDITGQLNIGQEYYLHEAEAPEGYKRAADVKFELQYAAINTTLQVVMRDEKTDISLSKTDFASELIAGAECELYLKNADGTKTKVDSWTSGTTPHTLAGKLIAGATYIYHEAKAPDGYGYSADIEFTVNANGNVTEAYYINSEGAKLLYDKDGFQTSIIVDQDGKYWFDGREITINKEGDAVDADNNILAKGVMLEIPVIENVVQMKDAPTNTIIKKVDSVTGETIEGVLLQIIDQNNQIVAEWTTDEDGTEELQTILNAGETYTLHEEATIEGYYYSRDEVFTANTDGKPQTIEMRNRPIKVVTPPEEFPPEIPPEGSYPTIWLLKDSIEDPDHILQGGTFQVLSEDKQTVLIDNFTMNGTLQEWNTILEADKSYWLHEVTPPDGYAKAEDVKFTVSHYGEDVQVTMTDKKTETIIKKIDQRTGLSLAGATLQLYKGPKKPPYAVYDPKDLVKEWTTDETGTITLKGELIAGETYTLHEIVTVEGYYYSYDIDFVVSDDGKPQTIVMQNRPIIVETPPDELPVPPTPDSEDKTPEYVMEKERVTLAPEKGQTENYGFYHKDFVDYDVTIKNTGKIALTMHVNDAFDDATYFSIPQIEKIQYFKTGIDQNSNKMGHTNSIDGSMANITIEPDGYAVITYRAQVLDAALENLSGAAKDDGLGYVNTATTTDVVGKYYEYSGEDADGDGKGDVVTEVTVTKDEYPTELGDKSDTANTPVQIPAAEKEKPRYTMEKERITEAPEKDETGMYGFRHGDIVTYQVHINNTGDMTLKMYVSDEFAPEIRKYFEDLRITNIEGEDISEPGIGVGTTTARVRIAPGETATVTYTAKVSATAPERLSFMTKDDGNGYENTARTYDVKAEKPDGTEGGSDEYPEIPDKEDNGNTPVQNPETPPEIIPPGPNEPEYPIIWLLKNSIEDPSHILSGGTFQVLSEDKKTVVIEEFTMNGTWQIWQTVLEADKSYWLHEVTPPDGYLTAEDVKFTVGHYGEYVEVIMTDRPIENVVTFTKEDFAGAEIPGALCELKRVESNGTTTRIDIWTSNGTPHVLRDVLNTSTTYRYHEERVPDGYGYSEDIEFTVDEAGRIVSAHYIDREGTPILYDKDGYPTSIKVLENGSYMDGNVSITIDENGNAIDKNGNIHAEGVEFEIATTGNVVRMKDAPTQVNIIKKSETGEILTGGRFVVLDKNKNEQLALTDTLIPSTEHEGTIRAGEPLRFQASANGVNITKQLNGGECYYLREEVAPAGYQLASDVEFMVPRTGRAITVTMSDTAKPEPAVPTPNYVMEKERVSLAPVKGTTNKYGFLHGNIVKYDVTIKNTGEMDLTMDVTDAFEKTDYFSTPLVDTVKFYQHGTTIENAAMGAVHNISGSAANITIKTGGYAVVTYKANVLEAALENLSGAAKDDGLGYINTATTTNVSGKYYEYSGEDTDGNGNGDIVTEVTVTKEEFPSELGDRSDTAHTPVQEPNKPADKTPAYTMEKERITDAPEKGTTNKYGFTRGQTVTYEVRVKNVGELPLKMYVSDEFASEIRNYFSDLKITKIDGEDISEEGMGIGHATARIRVGVGETAIITYTAKVSMTAPENLSFAMKDDGQGYQNTAKTYEVKAEKPDGTEGSSDEYPGIPDKEDDAHTPVQVPNKPDKPDKPSEPVITLPGVTVYKYDGNTMASIAGVEFEVSKDGVYMTTIKTASDSYARLYSLEDGVYQIKESKAAAGYRLSQQVFDFEVKNRVVEGGITTFHAANYKDVKVVITKHDAETGETLKGALLRISDENGEIVYEGRTDKNGQLTFDILQPGHYAVVELEAPRGYEIIDGYITFHVSENGAIEGTTDMYDYKKKSKGKITAKYENGFERGGWFDSDGKWHPLPKTGDSGSNKPALLMSFAAAFASLIVLSKKSKKEQKRKKDKE